MHFSLPKLLLALTTSALFAGCSSVPLADASQSANVKSFQTKAEVGQIYVCRSSTFFGAAIKPTIELDGKALSDIGRGTFLYAELPAGDHLLVTKTLEHDSKLPFSIAAGEQKFFQVWISMGVLAGWGIVDAMPTAEGKKCVSEGDLVASTAGKP